MGPCGQSQAFRVGPTASVLHAQGPKTTLAVLPSTSVKSCAHYSVRDITNKMIQWCNDSGNTVTTEAFNLAAVAASIATGHLAFNFAGCCLQSQKIGTHHQFSGQVRLLPLLPLASYYYSARLVLIRFDY